MGTDTEYSLRAHEKERAMNNLLKTDTVSMGLE